MSNKIYDDRFEDLQELIFEHGHPVFTSSWDSGGPGSGASCDSIYKFRGKYWCFYYDEFSEPFDTFEDAFNEGFYNVTTATKEIYCDEFSIEELVQRLNYMNIGEEHPGLLINNEKWRISSDGQFSKEEP